MAIAVFSTLLPILADMMSVASHLTLSCLSNLKSSCSTCAACAVCLSDWLLPPSLHTPHSTALHSTLLTLQGGEAPGVYVVLRGVFSLRVPILAFSLSSSCSSSSPFQPLLFSLFPCPPSCAPPSLPGVCRSHSLPWLGVGASCSAAPLLASEHGEGESRGKVRPTSGRRLH